MMTAMAMMAVVMTLWPAIRAGLCAQMSEQVSICIHIRCDII